MAKMFWKDEKDLLEEAKESKKEELSSACEEDILSGFYFEIGNNAYHFSYDREAQVNLQERWQLFQNNMIEELSITAHLEDEDVRLKVGRELFDEIYLASVKTKENKIKKLREDLFPLVDNVKSKKGLGVIKWDMSILEPKPETVILKNDELLNKEVKRVEASTAMSNAEMLNLIFMSQAGTLGGTMNLSGLTESDGDEGV